jgi:drug/metabolite transporter (DMT)-like permease
MKMNTTTLYAELIVVGSGTSIFIVLFFYSLFGDASWLSKLGGLSSIGSVVSLIPVLSVLYLLGIVITNVGHLVFKRWEERLRKKNLSDIKSEYEEVRTTLYTSTNKDLMEQFEFRRSKIRICRGWFINSILIIIALVTYLWTKKIPESTVWFWIVIVGLLMMGIGISWWNATITELEWLKSYAKQKKPDSKSR